MAIRGGTLERWSRTTAAHAAYGFEVRTQGRLGSFEQSGVSTEVREMRDSGAVLPSTCAGRSEPPAGFGRQAEPPAEACEGVWARRRPACAHACSGGRSRGGPRGCVGGRRGF